MRHRGARIRRRRAMKGAGTLSAQAAVAPRRGLWRLTLGNVVPRTPLSPAGSPHRSRQRHTSRWHAAAEAVCRSRTARSHRSLQGRSSRTRQQRRAATHSRVIARWFVALLRYASRAADERFRGRRSQQSSSSVKSLTVEAASVPDWPPDAARRSNDADVARLPRRSIATRVASSSTSIMEVEGPSASDRTTRVPCQIAEVHVEQRQVQPVVGATCCRAPVLFRDGSNSMNSAMQDAFPSVLTADTAHRAAQFERAARARSPRIGLILEAECMHAEEVR